MFSCTKDKKRERGVSEAFGSPTFFEVVNLSPIALLSGLIPADLLPSAMPVATELCPAIFSLALISFDIVE
jgi:hypothetical protein